MHRHHLAGDQGVDKGDAIFVIACATHSRSRDGHVVVGGRRAGDDRLAVLIRIDATAQEERRRNDVAGAVVGGAVVQGGAIAVGRVTHVEQVEAKVNTPVGVGVTIAIHIRCAIRLITQRQSDDATRHYATRHRQPVIIAVHIVIGVSGGRVAGAVVQQDAAEVGAADHDQVAAFAQVGEGVVAAVDRGAIGDKAIDTGGKGAVAVTVAVEFDAHAGQAAFAAVNLTVVVDIVPDAVAQAQGWRNQTGVNVGVLVAGVEVDGCGGPSRNIGVAVGRFCAAGGVLRGEAVAGGQGEGDVVGAADQVGKGVVAWVIGDWMIGGLGDGLLLPQAGNRIAVEEGNGHAVDAVDGCFVLNAVGGCRIQPEIVAQGRRQPKAKVHAGVDGAAGGVVN